MYRLETDAANSRIIITFGGAQGQDYLADLNRELSDAVRQVRKTSGHFDLLVDLRTAPILTKENAEESGRRMAWCAANGLRRSANVTSSALLKLQFKRVGADDRFRYFASMEEAVAWLDGDDRAAAQ